MDNDYVRRCPSCGAENAPTVMRCACGALLVGVDLVRPQPANPAAAPLEPEPTAPPASLLCGYEDCAQANPPGTEICLYCNRPLAGETALTPDDRARSLLNLPEALKHRYRILQPLPTRGAEAELLLVEAVDGGATRVAKIYRHGILPRREVQERIARVDVAHRVDVLETGVSEGYAYELMEFCGEGSLRRLMDGGPLQPVVLGNVVGELAEAIADVHAAGLIHRDLKPENVLIRARQPLDLVLTDFSISSILDATQRFTGTARTLPYAAPESLSGVIDGKADYWALGMIVLEGALGRHPFAGLSEPVILHHLTTRRIDHAEVPDRNLRKLLSGLLQRDPKLRWSAGEVKRWLAGDTSLAEPQDQGAISGFAEPYHIAGEICDKPEQLAVALAQHWREGVSDLANGELLAWFRDVQKNQDVVRLLLDNKFEKKLATDVQLLKLILHLAPGIPPVWRGESIELPAILSQANRALKGDADAAHRLDQLYRHRVLEIYAQAGNRQAYDLVQKWHQACDRFSQAWQDKLAIIARNHDPAQDYQEAVNFGQLLYGTSQPERPPLAAMHARLLAIAYAPSWSERLRRRLVQELARLALHCPWLVELGDPQSMDAAELLVVEALLPEAQKAAARRIKAGERQRMAENHEYHTLQGRLVVLMSVLRDTATERLATPFVCAELREMAVQYLGLIAVLQASGRTDPAWLEMQQNALRGKRAVDQLLVELDDLSARRAITAGWLNPSVLGFVLLAALFAPFTPALGVKSIVFIVLGIAVWRLLPDWFKMRKIRRLADKLYWPKRKIGV
ncbi:MAG: hypothetical protein EPN21_10670 [Methylococcaceae bacterium]|nr:MAG: hypothetical protein EPN21_10670 [Methylococcaceae bacterium]